MAWDKINLESVTTKIGSGATPTGGGNAYKSDGIGFIRSQNVLDSRFSYEGLVFIDLAQASLLANVSVQQNDVLMNITGDSVARVCKVPNDIISARVSQHVCIVRADCCKLEPKFLLYYLMFMKPELLAISEIGGTRRALTKCMIQELEIPLPLLPEQKAIASVLGSLEDKIDLLHRQNQTLEAFAETIFRQLFVEERSVNIIESVLEDVCLVITTGGTPSTKVSSYYDGNINWYSTKELKYNFLFESNVKISEEGLLYSAAKMFPRDTVVIAIYAAPTVGRLGILAKEASFNQAACGLVANEDKVCFEFIYLYLKLERDNLNHLSSGSAQQNLNVEKIKTYPVVIPDIDQMYSFRDVVRPIFKKMKANQNQIRTLESLRDTLLAKLMSGEVRVDYAEEEVEKVI